LLEPLLPSNNRKLSSTEFIKLAKDSITKINLHFDSLLKKAKEIDRTIYFKQQKNNTQIAKHCFDSLLKNPIENIAQQFSYLRKITNFTTDVLKATNSKDLSDVIKAYALHPTSYRLKLKYPSTIDIGGYFGIYGGLETIKNNNNYSIDNAKGTMGLTAPICINFNFRTGYKSQKFVSSKYNYLTISLSLIDIIAPVSYRFSNDSSAELPKNINFSQIFAPGIFIRGGIKKTPIVWYVGCQLAPKLRSFNNNNENTAIRFSAGVALDMPFFNIYKKKG
jgi:hypothetical protein